MLNSKKLISVIASTFSNAVFFRDIPQEASRKAIALTIDDVPARDDDSDVSTRQILDVIAHYNKSLGIEAKATFFVITNHLTPDSTIIKEIVEGGHEIGNHGTTDHRHAALPPNEFESEFIQAHQILTEFAPNQPIHWFRPGQAFYNKGMVSILKDQGKARGYKDQFALASMVPFDTRDVLDAPRFTLLNIKWFTFPDSILVLHGGLKEQGKNTVEVLKQLLPSLHTQGYEVVTLSELYNL